MEADMNERCAFVPDGQPAPSGTRRPREGVLSAISELADHVRAYNLSQADEVLTELLAVLHAEHET